MQKQWLKSSFQQKLSPAQIQLMKLLELSTPAFEERIAQELEDNLALEEETLNNPIESQENASSKEEEQENYDKEQISQEEEQENQLNVEDYYNEDEFVEYNLNEDKEIKNPIFQLRDQESFQEYLRTQLHSFNLNKEDFIIADFILDSIDLDGYLRRDFDSLVNDMAIISAINTNKEKIEELLVDYIHKLEPYGIGARNPQECILIQLKNKPSDAIIALAIKIIENAFEDLSKKHYEKIIHRFHITQEQLKLVLSKLEKLNPKPGLLHSEDYGLVKNIIPDFILNITNGDLELSLDSRNLPQLKISSSYLKTLELYKDAKRRSHERKTKNFIKKKIYSASWFIEAIKQREETLLMTMGTIVDYQKEYFLSGDEQKLRPMTLKDIATRVDMEISTISRVVNQKYINTPYGTLLIKKLFSESTLNEKGEEISTIEVKKVLEEFITKEDKNKPFTDEKLVELLKHKGYIIARRTVAKYREQLKIPIARLRKELL